MFHLFNDNYSPREIFVGDLEQLFGERNIQVLHESGYGSGSVVVKAMLIRDGARPLIAVEVE